MAQTYLDPLFLQAAQVISQLAKDKGAGDLTVAKVASDFSVPPNVQLGHVAFPCFQLSKALQKKPNEIATELAAALAGHSLFSKAQAAGPYLNLFFSAEFLGANVLAPLVSQTLLNPPAISMAPVMVEYSQPNTHKELHVGHMRNLCLGNALVRILRYSGRPVVATTFPGDVGTHVAKCLWYMKYHNKEAIPAHGKGEWLGRMYSVAHNKLEDEKGGPLEESNRQQLTAILKQLEQKQGEFYDLWKETRQWSIDLMNTLYKWADVKFDTWYWESDVDSDSVAWTKKLFAEGKLHESQGAVGLDLGPLGFCLLLKSDGNGLYATKDIELARRKFEAYNPSQSVYVVDLRQELHFKQVFGVLKQIGFEQADRCFHLKYNFVELPDGAMSSRKGNIIPITTLIHNMQEHVKKEYLNRYVGEWSAQEIDQTADFVAQGAIKFGMNAMDPNKKIVFKMEDWLRFDGESGPYIQYAYARIQTMLVKFPLTEKSPAWNLLTQPIETELTMKLAQFNKNIEMAAQNLKTSSLCTYLYETAKLFNQFYHECPIGKLEDKPLQQARLALSYSTGEVLKKGLELLGIPAPSKM